MTTTQYELSNLLADLNGKIADLETRVAALKDVRECAQTLLAKYAPVSFEDKDLASSGIYADESGYTAEDKQAASLVHDAELDPSLVDLCGKTTIHADADGWIKNHGKHCPVSNEYTSVEVKWKDGGKSSTGLATLWNWIMVDFWRYAK